jgi:uncharacterized protein (DUF1778 family)
MKKKNIGSSVDGWLSEEGISEEVTSRAITRVLTRDQENLRNRQHFGLTAKQWKNFHAALSAPRQRSLLLVKAS